MTKSLPELRSPNRRKVQRVHRSAASSQSQIVISSVLSFLPFLFFWCRFRRQREKVIEMSSGFYGLLSHCFACHTLLIVELSAGYLGMESTASCEDLLPLEMPYECVLPTD